MTYNADHRRVYVSEEIKEPSNAGRPPILTDRIKEIMLRMAPLGYNNKELAGLVGVAERTIYRWLEADEEFCHAISSAKDLADSIVVESLFKKATGVITTVEHTDGICPKTGDIIRVTKTKEIPPSDTAMIFWLKNRQPDKWKDRVETTITAGEININVDKQDEGL